MFYCLDWIERFIVWMQKILLWMQHFIMLDTTFYFDIYYCFGFNILLFWMKHFIISKPDDHYSHFQSSMAKYDILIISIMY